MVYGYFTTEERKKAQNNKLPAGTQPGNQARVRAVKRWVRENFPESRQKMIEYTDALYRRSEGAREAQELIDAEYTVFTTPLISPPGGKTGPPAGNLEGTKEAESAPPEPIDEKTPDDITEDDVPDLNAVYRICFHFWQMQPIEVCGQFGYSSQMDMLAARISPWEAWLTIKDFKQPRKE